MVYNLISKLSPNYCIFCMVLLFWNYSNLAGWLKISKIHRSCASFFQGIHKQKSFSCEVMWGMAFCNHTFSPLINCLMVRLSRPHHQALRVRVAVKSISLNVWNSWIATGRIRVWLQSRQHSLRSRSQVRKGGILWSQIVRADIVIAVLILIIILIVFLFLVVILTSCL